MTTSSQSDSEPEPAPELEPVRKAEFARDVLLGLSRTPKTLPCQWFYDAKGGELFARIMDLPEYYLTPCEMEILENRGDDLIAAIEPGPLDLFEIGPGNGRKTRLLLGEAIRSGLDIHYYPIEVSPAALRALQASLAEWFPDLAVRPLLGDAFQVIPRIPREKGRRAVVCYLGASFGNFTYEEGLDFLRLLRATLVPEDGVLLGFDLKKDIPTIHRAYDDTAGLTREFNLNLLRRINRELGGHFDVDRFAHHTAYDVTRAAMESYLVSTCAQSVRIDALGRSFEFGAWEGIQTERSGKHDLLGIEEMARLTGFQVRQHILDEKEWFVISAWSAA